MDRTGVTRNLPFVERRDPGTQLEQTIAMRRAILAVLFAVVCAGSFAALSTV